ncbi:hypothetical protein ElyMa_000268100 [Elysia marginata]|uniref:Uncharacterized protein n=1 Tax=Elysia marginata TaxID=1093978 RepID=A0AAV4F6Z0_9GAST|nr:hypothetical protein ElyMa_000268100 [Elysia marginata]
MDLPPCHSNKNHTAPERKMEVDLPLCHSESIVYFADKEDRKNRNVGPENERTDEFQAKLSEPGSGAFKSPACECEEPPSPMEHFLSPAKSLFSISTPISEASSIDLMIQTNIVPMKSTSTLKE